MKKLLLTLLVAILALPTFAQTTATITLGTTGLGTEAPYPDPENALDGAVSFDASDSKAKAYLAGFFNVDGVASTGLADYGERSFVSVWSETLVDKITFNLKNIDPNCISEVYLEIFNAKTAGTIGTVAVDEVDVKSLFDVNQTTIVVDMSKYIASLNAGAYLYSFRFETVQGAAADGGVLGINSLVLSYKTSVSPSLAWNKNYKEEFDVVYGARELPTFPRATAVNGRLSINYRVKSGDAVTVNLTTGAITISKVGTAVVEAYVPNNTTVEPISYTINVEPATATLSWGTGHSEFFYADKSLTLGSTNYPVVTNSKNVKLKYSLQKAITGVTINGETGELTFGSNFTPVSTGTDVTVVAAIDDPNFNDARTTYILTINPNITWSANPSYETVYAPNKVWNAPKATLRNDKVNLSYTATPSTQNVITLDPTTGAVTVLNAGTVTVTATAGLTSLSYELTVTPAEATLTFLGETVEVAANGGTAAAPTLRKNPSTVPVRYEINPKDKDIVTVNAITGELTGGTNTGTVVVSAIINSDNYTGEDATFTVIVNPAYNAGTLNLTYANTTTNLNGDARLVSSANTMYVSSTGITRSNGQFVVADNATITFDASKLDYYYQYLTIDSDDPLSFSLKAYSIAASSTLANQTESVSAEKSPMLPLDMQSNAYYTLTFTKGGKINQILLETPKDAVTAPKDAKLYAIVAASINAKGEPVMTQNEVGGSFSAATNIFGSEGKGGQNVRLFFDNIDGTVFYAFTNTSKSTVYYSVKAANWDDSFLDAESGELGLDVKAITDATTTQDKIDEANTTKEGVYTAYAPGSYLNLENNYDLSYFVKNGNVLGEPKTVTFSSVTGIEDVMVDEAAGEAVYYNLQGVKIANPTPGQVYVRVIGKKADKVVFK